MRRMVPCVCAVGSLALILSVWMGAPATAVRAQALSQQPLQERQLPVFRSDSHFVRVDAYPTDKDGAVIRGLTADDFVLTEDGKPQAIDSSEFIEYERWKPGVDPPEPRDQRESFRLAADPRYRVMVVYVNRLSWANARYVREPLITMLTREVGPRDLFGLVLPYHEASDLVLGRFTPGTQAQLSQFLQINNHMLPQYMEPAEQKLLQCFGQAATSLINRWRVDNLYRDLEGLIRILGTLRDERKSIVLVTESMPGVMVRRGGGGGGVPPTMGSGWTPPTGNRQLPGAGGLSAGTYQPDNNSAAACQMLAASIPEPHYERFQELIKLARRMNVAINPISPAGLTMNVNWNSGYLRQLAEETGGIAVVNSNGVAEGFRKVANDQSAYYVLGYYTSNTKWDGKLRELRVKLKSTGKTIRARYEYQAPTEADMAAMRAAAAAPPRPPGPTPVESAMNMLARLRPDSELHVNAAVRGQSLVVAVEIPPDAGRLPAWRDGATIEVTATDAQGQSVSRQGRLAPGTRGVEVPILVGSSSRGPWQVRTRAIRTSDTVEDQARATHPESAFGEALLYRAAPQPAAPYLPAATPQFWRTERMRAEWLLPKRDTAWAVAARMLQTSGTPLSYAPPVVTEDTADGVKVRVDLSLAPFATADYLIEVTASSGAEQQRALQVIRVLR